MNIIWQQWSFCYRKTDNAAFDGPDGSIASGAGDLYKRADGCYGLSGQCVLFLRGKSDVWFLSGRGEESAYALSGIVRGGDALLGGIR